MKHLFIFIMLIGMNRADHPTSGENSTLFSFLNSWDQSERNIAMATKINLINQRFGRLTVIKPIGNTKDYQTIWMCLCDCGNYKNVKGGNLKSGNTTSCGCYSRELLNKNKYCMTHGNACKNNISPEFKAWDSIIQRCTNPKNKSYKNYGSRGIKVCDRWLEKNGFINFLADIGKRPEGYTLDRINNDGNYEPGNCRWTTWRQQERNRRNNKLTALQVIEIRRITDKTQNEIALKFNVTQSHINRILNNKVWIL